MITGWEVVSDKSQACLWSWACVKVAQAQEQCKGKAECAGSKSRWDTGKDAPGSSAEQSHYTFLTSKGKGKATHAVNTPSVD
eukprot:scaffold28168_cov14-Tisochrysis_lutea.AAC.1